MCRVGIAADGRREVAIAIAGQGVVALFLGTVNGPLHRPQHGVVHRMLLGKRGHRVEQLLQLEAVVQAAHGQAQLADELVQGAKLVRAGRFVDPPQERQALVAEQFGHRLVGRQHELFDHLVALGVFDHVGPGHAAVGVQIDLDLRHRQHQRAMPDAAAAEEHRQLVHAAQQAVDLGPELLLPALAVGQESVDLLVGQPLAALDGGRMELAYACGRPRACTP